MRDPTDTRNLEAAQAERDRLTKIEAERLAKDMRVLMSSDAGRRFVWRILEIAGVFRSSFNNSGSVTAFNEGARNVGLQVMAMVLDHCPDEFIQMMRDKHE